MIENRFSSNRNDDEHNEINENCFILNCAFGFDRFQCVVFVWRYQWPGHLRWPFVLRADAKQPSKYAKITTLRLLRCAMIQFPMHTLTRKKKYDWWTERFGKRTKYSKNTLQWCEILRNTMNCLIFFFFFCVAFSNEKPNQTQYYYIKIMAPFLRQMKHFVGCCFIWFLWTEHKKWFFWFAQIDWRRPNYNNNNLSRAHIKFNMKMSEKDESQQNKKSTQLRYKFSLNTHRFQMIDTNFLFVSFVVYLVIISLI